MERASLFTSAVENGRMNDVLAIPASVFEREESDNELSDYGSDSDFIPEEEEKCDEHVQEKLEIRKKKKRSHSSDETESENERKRSAEKRRKKRRKRKEKKKEKNSPKRGKKRRRNAKNNKEPNPKRRKVETRSYRLQTGEHRCCCPGECSVWSEHHPDEWSQFTEDLQWHDTEESKEGGAIDALIDDNRIRTYSQVVNEIFVPAFWKLTVNATEDHIRQYGKSVFPLFNDNMKKLSEKKAKMYMALILYSSMQCKDFFAVKKSFSDNFRNEYVKNTLSQTTFFSIHRHIRGASHIELPKHWQDGYHPEQNIQSTKILSNRSKTLRNIGQVLTLDGMGYRSKFRLRDVTFLRGNPHQSRYAYRSIGLCDFSTIPRIGYLLDEKVKYKLKSSWYDPNIRNDKIRNNQTLSLAYQIIQPYFGRGHHVCLDSEFNRIYFLEELYANQTGAFGTCRQMPGCTPPKATLERWYNNLQIGEWKEIYLKRYRGRPSRAPITFTMFKQKANKVIFFMDSVFAQSKEVAPMYKTYEQNSEQKWILTSNLAQPLVCFKYNQFRCGIDVINSMRATHSLYQKTCRKQAPIYWARILHGFLNAWLLWKDLTASPNSFKECLYDVMIQWKREWIEACQKLEPVERQYLEVQRHKREQTSLQLAGLHRPIPTEKDYSEKCAVCKESTRTICSDCVYGSDKNPVQLCGIRQKNARRDCFERWHEDKQALIVATEHTREKNTQNQYCYLCFLSRKQRVKRKNRNCEECSRVFCESCWILWHRLK